MVGSSLHSRKQKRTTCRSRQRIKERGDSMPKERKRCIEPIQVVVLLTRCCVQSALAAPPLDDLLIGLRASAGVLLMKNDEDSLRRVGSHASHRPKHAINVHQVEHLFTIALDHRMGLCAQQVQLAALPEESNVGTVEHKVPRAIVGNPLCVGRKASRSVRQALDRLAQLGPLLRVHGLPSQAHTA
eukprot:scaffold56339_cov31-Tisochrysis_lutea.AAC.2